MTLGGRIHAVAAAFAVGYLFVGSVALRSEGALAMSVPKVLLGVAVAWVVWMGTGDAEPRMGEDEVQEGDSVTSGREPASLLPASPPPNENRGAISRSLARNPARTTMSPARMKRLSELAFANGWAVEAAYWLAIALLRGGTDRAERMRDYVEAWLAMGCPDELENVHAGFSETQGAFGRSVLRFHSGSGLAVSIACFSQMAHDGDEDARAFLGENGIELPRKGAT